jgi:hypothetical protein
VTLIHDDGMPYTRMELVAMRALDERVRSETRTESLSTLPKPPLLRGISGGVGAPRRGQSDA